MVRRKKYKRQGITGKTPSPQRPFPPLVFVMPRWYLSYLFGTACTHTGTTNTALYERYQRLVLRVPSRGISRYILSYEHQALTIIFPERYLRRSLSPTSGTYSASLRFIYTDSSDGCRTSAKWNAWNRRLLQYKRYEVWRLSYACLSDR